MKKVLFILIVVFAFAIASCGSKKTSVDTSAVVDSTTVVVDTVKVQ